jgi:hypothetical protein
MRLIFTAAVATGLIWFLRSFWRWKTKQVGDANELDWLDEVVREHLAGKQDHSAIIRRAIEDIERDHDPSPTLARELRRAREAIGDKPT